MDLVNEYLRAVAGLLPKAQRDDIIAELRDTILSRIEEREGELGRPLTDDEVEAVLREVGHPVVVAARYREGPQHVVGPALYPYWLLAVKAAIALQVAAAVVVIIVRSLAFGDVSRIVSEAVGSGVTGTLVLIGAATCTAWVLERRGARIAYLDNWRVRDLRMLEIVSWDFDQVRTWVMGRQGQRANGYRRPGPPPPPSPGASFSPPPMGPPAPPPPPPWHPAMQPIARGLSFVAFGTLLVLWWTGVLPLNFGLRDTDWSSLDVSPGALAAVDWTGLHALMFWPVLGYGALVILQGALLLAYPWATRLQGLAEALRGVALLGLCAWLWTLSPLAKAIRVTLPAGFIERMATLGDTPPLPLEPIATLAVLITGFTACGLIVRGLLNLIFGGPSLYEPAPPPGVSNSRI